MPIASHLQVHFSNKVTPDNFTIKKCGKGYLLSCPDIGALSLLNSEEVLLFAFLWKSTTPVQLMINFLLDAGYEKNEVDGKVYAFLSKTKNEGWFRTELIPAESIPLRAAYVTVTLKCNLSCPYCYQKFSERYHGNMEKNTFLSIVEQVTAINPNCEFIITGGEPFYNRDIFWYLNVLTEHRAFFSVLTNGSLITAGIATKLSKYTNLSKVQVSIDGITDDINAITRGKGTLARILRGIEALRKEGIALALAPTVHKQNLKEFEDIAILAMSIGAELSPNNLRKCADKRLNALFLDPMSAYDALKKINTGIANNQIAAIDDQKVLDKQEKNNPRKCSPQEKHAEKGASLVCGMARSVVNFDWNGDVYPCHLLAVKKFKMGNVTVDTIQNVLNSQSTRAMRVPSIAIEKCKSCSFVVSCAGGCRADAYHTYGRLDKEDSICNVLHKSMMDTFVMKSNKF